MIQKLRDKNGIRLFLKDSIVTENIDVVPELQNLTVTGEGTYHADEGYAGIGEVTVEISHECPNPTTEEAEVTPSTDTQYVTPTNADYLSKVTVLPIPDTYVPEVAKGRYQFNSEINGYGLNTLADEDEVTEFLSSAENAIAGTLDMGYGDLLMYMFPYKTSDGTVSVIAKLAEEEVPLFVLLPSGDVTEDWLTDSILNVVYAGKHSNWIFENTKKPQ